MNDYRGMLCLLDGEYLAKCISQNFNSMTLTFEVEPNGDTFERTGENGVEVYKHGNLTFEDVKDRLPRVNL